MSMVKMRTLLLCFACSWMLPIIDAAKALDNVHNRHKRQANDDDPETLPSGALIHEFLKDVGSKIPTDLVVLLDRSQGMNKFNFYIRSTKLVRQLVSQYVLVHPNYTHLTVITFATYPTTVFDYIGSQQDRNIKCIILDEKPRSVFDNITYDSRPDVWSDTNLKSAFVKVSEVLSSGERVRSKVKQVVLAVTDGNYKPDQDPVEEVRVLRDKKVKLYTVGLGNWLAPGNVREIATNASYYGTFDQWNNMVNDNLTSYSRGRIHQL